MSKLSSVLGNPLAILVSNRLVFKMGDAMSSGLSLRQTLVAMCLVSMGLLAYGLYLQHVVGLVPCPMCIVQRYALFLIAALAALTGASSRKGFHSGGLLLLIVCAGFGAFVAARQSWLQWYPPEVATCGRDFYGMIENFPLQRAIPMIFKGGGDCTKVDWTFLGGSIANWSFLCFCGILLVSGWLLSRTLRR
jgi:protein dithiol:quinone oxidoreductase